MFPHVPPAPNESKYSAVTIQAGKTRVDKVLGEIAKSGIKINIIIYM